MRKMQAMWVAALLTVFTGVAHAQEMSAERVVPADDMTCSQAVAYYQKYKLIYKRVWNGSDVIPIYGKTPIGEWRKVHCSGRGQSLKPYYLRTKDKNHCSIAVYCG